MSALQHIQSKYIIYSLQQTADSVFPNMESYQKKVQTEMGRVAANLAACLGESLAEVGNSYMQKLQEALQKR